MKKLLALFLLFATIGHCSSAQAGIISISMTDPSGEFDLGPGDRAGVVPSVNWNNVPYAPNQNGRTTIGQVIFGSDGEETPLGLTYRAWDGRNSGSVIGNDPNARMMKGKGPSPVNSSSDPHTYAAIELTGCNAAAGAVYDVYVYINEGIGFTTGSYGTMYLSGAGTFGSGGPPSGASIAAQTGYRTLNSRWTNTAGIAVYSADRGFIRSNASRAGNYLLFEGVTLDTLTITPWMANDQSNFHGVGMTGIQLVPVRSEDCDNGADDDGDGDVDCEDSDCPACPEICDNGIDDDRDGKADCRDLDCPACPEICDNGIDDDRDRDIDCDDEDCSGVEPCRVIAFIRGDPDGNGAVQLTDGIFILNFLFLGGDSPGCFEAADADDNGAVQMTDGIYILNFLFLGGAAMPAPHPDCGTSGEDAEPGCEASSAACG
ncbi:MAG: hypothetical protein MK138_02570 [Planctomycetes bacterium]|nr:hypothetical protein [Planctomycetota bacterium]